VTEQSIMDSMLEANRHGHIACTQGGECLAGLRAATGYGLVTDKDFCVLDATAHALKFMDFQNMYFTDSFPPEFGVTPRPELMNAPELMLSDEQRKGLDEREFILQSADAIARRLGLAAREDS
jgi:threonine synthase